MFVTLDDPCMTLPCEPNGWCEVDPIMSDVAHCMCLPGFYGPLCEFSGTAINVIFTIRFMTW